MAETGLRCFQGESAPVMVVDGWNRFCRFPAEAREPFLDLLQPVILDPANPGILAAVRDLATNQGLREEDVSAALQAGSILYTQVGALDLASEDLKSDLEALSRGEGEAATAFLSRFDATKNEVRNSIILGTLTDHGKVIVGVDWRVDEVTESDRGAALTTSVVFLTLRYQDGDRLERINLQLTPDAMRQLKAFTARFDG